jgi:hypothetical protein
MKKETIIVHKCADKPGAKKSGWIAYVRGKVPAVQAFAKTKNGALRILSDKLQLS